MARPPPDARPRLPRLRHWRDWQSLAYLVALPAFFSVLMPLGAKRPAIA